MDPFAYATLGLVFAGIFMVVAIVLEGPSSGPGAGL